MADEKSISSDDSMQSAGKCWADDDGPSRKELVDAIRTVVSLAACWFGHSQSVRGNDRKLVGVLNNFVKSMRAVEISQREHSQKILTTIVRDELAIAAHAEDEFIAEILANDELATANAALAAESRGERRDAEMSRLKVHLASSEGALQAARDAKAQALARYYETSAARGNRVIAKKRAANALPVAVLSVWSSPRPSIRTFANGRTRPDPVADAVRRSAWNVGLLLRGTPTIMDEEKAVKLADRVRDKGLKQGLKTNAAVVAAEICHVIRLERTSAADVAGKAPLRSEVDRAKSACKLVDSFLRYERHPDEARGSPTQVDLGWFFGARGRVPPPVPGDEPGPPNRAAGVGALLAEVCAGGKSVADAVQMSGSADFLDVWDLAARGLSAVVTSSSK